MPPIPMRTLSIRLPDSLLRHARALAARDGISVNQVIALALAEKVFAVMSEEERAARAAAGTEDIREQFPGIAWSDGAPSSGAAES
jgi:hypothetical protein